MVLKVKKKHDKASVKTALCDNHIVILNTPFFYPQETLWSNNLSDLKQWHFVFRILFTSCYFSLLIIKVGNVSSIYASTCICQTPNADTSLSFYFTSMINKSGTWIKKKMCKWLLIGLGFFKVLVYF